MLMNIKLNIVFRGIWIYWIVEIKTSISKFSTHRNWQYNKMALHDLKREEIKWDIFRLTPKVLFVKFPLTYSSFLF